MKKFLLIFLSVIPLFGSSIAQGKFYTKSGVIRFESKAPLEDIEAINKSVVCVFDMSSNAIQFSMNIRGFEFKKALMQEHFNENYMESDRFPKAEFKGVLDDAVNGYGTFDVKAKGNLFIHGVSKEITIPGKLVVSPDKIQLIAEFIIAVADYKIIIPSLVRDKVAKTVKIIVNASLIPLK
ncbi:MAG: YceI family protein [Flavitalea sp.]